MERRIDALDWSRTSLGPRERWPQSLRTALGMVLKSRYPEPPEGERPEGP
jgi:hypothetical protein